MSKIQWFKKNFTRTEVFFLIVGASIPIILLIVFVISQINLDSGEQKIRNAWRIRILDKFKNLETNQTSEKLEELTSQIGIDVTPSMMKGRRPEKDLQHRFKELHKLIRTYIQSQLSKENSSIDPFPDPILHYCDAYRPQIREIIALLNSNSAPTWALQVSDPKSPWPNLLGHINLEHVLTLHVLESIRSNDPQEAVRTFQAMTSLNQAIFQRPEILSNLIAFSVVKLELGIIRKWPWKLISDQEKILNRMYRQNFLDGLFWERVGYPIRIMDNPQMHLLYPKWYVKRAAVDIGEKNLERIKIVSSVDDCSTLPSTIDQIRYAPWNSYADYSLTEHDRWSKYLHLLIDLEFTRRIVDLKDTGKQLGSWPSVFPKSSIVRCQSARIDYLVDDDNNASITIRNVPATKDDAISLLSRSFRFSKDELTRN